MKKSIYIISAIALGISFTACNNSDTIIGEQKAEKAPVYRIVIPASMGDNAATKAVSINGTGGLDATFRTTDNIWVYNITQSAGSQDKLAANYLLHPDADATTANLTGELKFSKWNPSYEAVTPALNDQLMLLYNTNNGQFTYTTTGTFDYLSSLDFASATVSIESIAGNATDGYTITTSDAHFQNAQSMYKFTFTGLPTGVGVKRVIIHSAGNKLINSCRLYDNWENNADIDISLDNDARTANGAGVVYASLRFISLDVNDTDIITFTVTGTDDNTYTSSKTTPLGGFVNGRYYTADIPVTTLALAAVTDSDLGKVIGADGNIYADDAAATAAGTTAKAMIAFVGSQNGVCSHGLAISLTDAYAYNATFAEATGDNIIPSWQTYHAVTGGTWRLPSEKDWQYLMWGYYTDSPVAAPVGIAKTSLAGGYYWTSTAVDDANAKGIYYDGTTYASVQSLDKSGTWHVRACLAF